MPKNKWYRNLTIFLIFCAFIYPLIGLLFGHYYPKIIPFGMLPCPTVAFTLALLSGSIPKVDKKVYILLLCWAIASIERVLVVCCFEDSILFLIGIYSLVLLVKNWKEIKC